MPRRISDIEISPAISKKKVKHVEESPNLDVSFFDDEALPPGIIFTDVQLKKWRIGKPIGRGSFGRIYLASDDIENDVTKQNARYVVKIEPHTNGPLFVEIHCMIRTGQVSKVKAWKLQNKLKKIGMPLFIANGSFTDDNTGTKYRFLVLPRYDIDLQKIIARTKILDLKNVLILSLQILDVLEYLHNHGYTHSDIKSSNLMLGFDGNKFVKASPSKNTSFQKESKQVDFLSVKHRKAKTGKSRPSNYYDDEDFTVTKKNTHGEQTVDGDNQLANVNNNIKKIISDKDYRTLHRHHSFNLRQLSNYVNYEDLSSACSDRSYQKLLDDYGNRTLMFAPKKLKDEVKTVEFNDLEMNMDQIYKEAVLSQSNGQIYLLDYGLATKFLDSEGNHKDFVMDARKAHDGTLEYSSRDSHIGAHSRRSDLETLGYNMLDWLTGTLPWKTKEVLVEPDLVHALKKNFMTDIRTLLKTCFQTEFYPQVMEKYLQYITSLDYTEKPDYDYCRNLFRNELIKNGLIFDREISLNFAEPVLSPVGRNKLCYSKRFGRKNTPPDFIARNGIKKASQRENVCSLENNLKLELLKQTLNTSSEGMRKPCASRNFFISDADLIKRLKKSLMPHDVVGKKLSPKNLRSKKNNITKYKGTKRYKNNLGKFGNFMGSAKQFSWAEILAGNPENIIRKERHISHNEYEEENDDTQCKYKIRKLSVTSHESCSNDANIQSPLMQKDYLHNLNPTYAMREVLANLKKKVTGKALKEQEDCPSGLEGYTPAMIKLHKSKQKREAKEKLDMLKQHLVKKEFKMEPRCTRSMSKFLTENDTTSNLIRKNHSDSNIGIFNTSGVDSHANTSSAENYNQVRLRSKNSAINKKIKDELICNDDRATETDSRVDNTAPKNCIRKSPRRTKNVANKKYVEDYVTYNIGRNPRNNSCVASKSRNQIGTRRAKSVTNKKKVEDNSIYNDRNTSKINSCVSSKTCDQIGTRKAKSITDNKVLKECSTYDDVTKNSSQLNLRRAKSFANNRNSESIEHNHKVLDESFVNNNDQIKTLRTRKVASNIQVKNASTTENCTRKNLQSVPKTLPNDTGLSDRIRTRSTSIVITNSNVGNVKPSETKPYLKCPASRSIDQFKKHRGKNVALKKEANKDTAMNSGLIKMLHEVGAASTKRNDGIPARINRSVTNKEKPLAGDGPKKPATSRNHMTKVVPNRRRLRSSKRKKTE